MKVAPILAPQTDGDRDRDWLPEHYWDTIPAHLHHAIEQHAARHRHAAVASVPAVLDALAERTAIIAYLEEKARDRTATKIQYLAGGDHPLARDLAQDIARGAAREAGTYHEAAVAVRYDSHALHRQALLTPPADRP